MKQSVPLFLLVLALSLFATAVTMAQDDADVEEPPEYAGSSECRDCHSSQGRIHSDTAHNLTLVEIEDDMDEDEYPVVADFSQSSDLLTVMLPDDSTPITLSEDNIAYTLGAGRHVQAFVYAVDAEAGEYLVWPAQWDVQAGAWASLDLAESWPDPAYDFIAECASCHVVNLNPETAEWEDEGVGCESCHGPGLAHVEAADDAGGSIDDEERAEIFAAINVGIDSQTCGQCHSRGEDLDSAHPYPTGYYPGGDLSAIFALPSTDDSEYWWETTHARLPNMQYNETVISGHPNGLETAQNSEYFSAECLACHSAATLRVDQLLAYDDEDIPPESIDPLAVAEDYPFGVTCASCHHPHMPVMEDEDGEDIPNPANLLRAEPYALCTSCHTDNDVTDGLHHPIQQVFEGQPLVEEIEAIAGTHFTAENGPTCSSCHMVDVPTKNGERASHTFQLVEPGEAANIELMDSCTICHEESPLAMQALIDDVQANTMKRVSDSREALNDDSPEWVLLALDAIEGDGSNGVHNFAYTSAMLNSIEIQLGLVEGSGALDSATLRQQIDDLLPDVEPQDTTADLPPPPEPVVGNLTMPSLVILGISTLILIVAGFAFFRSNGQ